MRSALPTYLPKPRLFITFDDGKASDYTTSYPIMKAAGFRGTSYIMSNKVGTPGFVTLAQLQEMYADGWCIGNHTSDHNDLSSIESGDLESITAVRDYLIANGMPRGANQFAYPYGAGWNVPSVQAHLAAIGVETARLYGGGDYIAVTPSTDRYTGIYTMSPVSTTTLAQLKAAVRAIITSTGLRTCIMTFHLVDDEAHTYSTPTPVFRDFIRWLVTQKPAVRISTMDEFEPWLADPRYASWDRAEESQPVVTQTSAIPAATKFCNLSHKAITLNSISQCTGIQHFELESMHGSTEASVDALLKSVSDALLADPTTFSGVGVPTLDLTGNPAPSGIYRPPTGAGGAAASGLESLWAIANHSNPWVVRYNGGVAIKRIADHDLTVPGFVINVIGAGYEYRTYASKYVARTGIASGVTVNLKGPSALKFALYSDNAGNPDALLGQTSAKTCGIGVNRLTFTTPVALTSGTPVWLASKFDTYAPFGYDAYNGTTQWKLAAYSDAFTDPWGASGGSNAVKFNNVVVGAVTL